MNKRMLHASLFSLLLNTLCVPCYAQEKEPSLSGQDDAHLPTELQKKDTSTGQWVREFAKEEEKIEFNFEDADLENLLLQISDIFSVTFITDDIVQPMQAGAKAVRGNKFSFKTNKPLSREQAWDLFITFLDLAGLMTVPDGSKTRYRIMSTEAARKAPIPSYIGTEPHKLPDNEQLIRYVYFIQNSTLDAIKPIVDALRSSASAFFVLNDLNAFVLTDKAYNIQALMKIVSELDRVSMPQALSILQLNYVDAEYAKKKYDELVHADDKGVTARLFPAKKPQTASFFPDNARLIAEPRTNRLILLGPKDSLEKIEYFIRNDIDREVEKPYSPLRPYSLKYADATTVANIMNELVQFGKETEAGKSGGIRGRDKYFKPITFTAEPETNRLIIKGDEEDFLRVKDIIQKLDEPQPQVAIEILVLSVSVDAIKRLGTQLRSKKNGGINGLVGDQVKFQTSGLDMGTGARGIVPDNTGTGINRLLGDLINLVVPSAAGNTVISLGSDAAGVWGIFDVLDQVTDTQIVANPFLVAMNNKESKITVGEIRRVITSTVISGTTESPSFDNLEAALVVTAKPQINSDGMILLNLSIKFDQFTNPIDQQSATMTNKLLSTSTIVSDQEVLAIGGLIVNKTTDTKTKVPVLGDIPLIGWLFKNEDNNKERDILLVLISTRIIEAEDREKVLGFTKTHIDDYHQTLNAMHTVAEKRDPVHKLFFADSREEADTAVDDFIFRRRERELLKGRTKVKVNLQGDELPHLETTDPMPILPEKPTEPVSPLAVRKRKSLVDLVEDTHEVTT